MLKAAYGGGGRGMRVVTQLEDVEEQFHRAQVCRKALITLGKKSFIYGDLCSSDFLQILN